MKTKYKPTEEERARLLSVKLEEREHIRRMLKKCNDMIEQLDS